MLRSENDQLKLELREINEKTDELHEEIKRQAKIIQKEVKNR